MYGNYTRYLMNRQSELTAERKAAWMRAFETAVTAALPAHAGRVCWDDALHFHRNGHTAATAAARYVEMRTGGEEAAARALNGERADHDQNLQRLLWIAAGDISEEAFATEG